MLNITLDGLQKPKRQQRKNNEKNKIKFMRGHDFNMCTMTRYYLKITQQELANRFCVDIQWVQRLEKRRILPTVIIYALLGLKEENEKNPNPVRLEYKRQPKQPTYKRKEENYGRS